MFKFMLIDVILSSTAGAIIGCAFFGFAGSIIGFFVGGIIGICAAYNKRNISFGDY